MNSIETKRIVYISNPNEKYQRMVTMNATDDYNCHVLALCPVSYTHLTLPTNREV